MTAHLFVRKNVCIYFWAKKIAGRYYTYENVLSHLNMWQQLLTEAKLTPENTAYRVSVFQIWVRSPLDVIDVLLKWKISLGRKPLSLN